MIRVSIIQNLVILFIFFCGCYQSVRIGTCDSTNCSNHGQCVVSDGHPFCLCDEGFQAQELECIPTESDGDGDSDVDADGEADSAHQCVGESFSEGMVLVPAGSFGMGCNPEDPCAWRPDLDNFPRHQVYLDTYEIDQIGP